MQWISLICKSFAFSFETFDFPSVLLLSGLVEGFGWPSGVLRSLYSLLPYRSSRSRICPGHPFGLKLAGAGVAAWPYHLEPESPGEQWRLYGHKGGSLKDQNLGCECMANRPLRHECTASLDTVDTPRLWTCSVIIQVIPIERTASNGYSLHGYTKKYCTHHPPLARRFLLGERAAAFQSSRGYFRRMHSFTLLPRFTCERKLSRLIHWDGFSLTSI